MDYSYENLGFERFQEFCQALLAKEFPNTQAFPTGQPDGGRDSIAYLMSSATREFIIFQIKYVKNPLQIKDPHKWLTDTIAGESRKIKKLIPKGAVKYYLITNVKGTAHFEVGSIDKVNDILAESIKIPSFCWWRDDLSRRLEANTELKWSFMELLSGQDVLNSLLFSHINEFKQKRENAIRAYLVDQYLLDDQVKFRQVDLQNRLLSLFTDVPLRLKKFDVKNKKFKKRLYRLLDKSRTLSPIDDSYLLFDEVRNFGAAEFLLSSEAQNNIERILLEGGPGQGKSTISQYISQIHRIHLLNKKDDLAIIPESFNSIQIRLPFKIDLRHVAAWVENKNPYPTKLNDDVFNSIWQKSLESFILGHILHHSQLDFDKNDFIEICKLSPILLVFDGFDEIANLKIREEVIDLINKGIDRISENAKSVQVLITSRPAAFIDSVGFSVERYPHFELTDVTPEITKEYVEKWIKASKLDSREASEIRKLVEDKLEMPHLKDLAKSPMQLAIFISLLRKKGESLPNKRTALYGNYIELFFDRESEKSTIIRDNRDLIIDIHEYLGWLLHSEAEMYKSSGSIEINSLKKRLKDYLEKEGHKTDITDKLFDVVKERVCALASRVQGTFEFEVQPLREYFCAKYLYKTSPYSPVGFEKSGTKPERFEAIAPNYYWQNTVRFFAGCFDKGELPMLIQQLKELQESEHFKFTNYPRILTSQILSDWVFTQYPLLLRDVIKIILDGINIGSILNQNPETRNSYNEPIILPIECGRNEIIVECFEQLKTFPLNDYSNELIGVIKNNPLNTVELWTKYAGQIDGEKLTHWFNYGYKLQILHKIDNGVLKKILFKDKSQLHFRLSQLINSGKIKLLDDNIEFKEIALSSILNNNINIVFQRAQKNHSLKFLTSCLRLSSLAKIVSDDDINIPYFNLIGQRSYYYRDYEREHSNPLEKFDAIDAIDKNILSFKNKIEPFLSKDISLWKTKIEPWDILVENGVNIFGKFWIFSVIGVIAAGIRSREERYENFDNLNDHSKSLCKRIRCARMKSGNLKYWEGELKDPENLELKLLIFFTWATPKVIIHFLPSLNTLIESLSNDSLKRVIFSLKKTCQVTLFNSIQQKSVEDALHDLELLGKLKYIISIRMESNNKLQFVYQSLDQDSDSFQDILNLKLEYLIEQYLKNTKNESILQAIKDLYYKLSNYPNKNYYGNKYYNNDSIDIPIGIAQKIMAECKNYPRVISSISERVCRLFAFKHTKSVGIIAQQNHWFQQ